MLGNLWTNSAPQMVGIDIGSHEIKAVLLDKSTDGYKIANHISVPLRKGAVVDHNIRESDSVAEALSVVKRRFPKSVKYAAASVSGSAVMTKMIYMDASLSEEEMESQIEIEADNLIPYSLDEVSIDFETLNVNSVDPTKVDVLLSACRTENIDAKVDALDQIELEAKVIDVEGYALGRSYDLIVDQLPEGAADKVVAMIDIGAHILTFAAVEKGETTFIREQTFGGEQFTQSIQSFYGMSNEDAERAKVMGELPRDYMFEVLSPFQTQLLQQIKRTLQIYCTASGKENVDYIVLSGGTARLEGIANVIMSELSIQTIIADPFKGCLTADDKDIELLQDNICKYMVAFGLALRSYAQWRT